MNDSGATSLDPASDPRVSRIPARSHRQSMDWSLVLLSQGIESIIERPRDGQGWTLLVETKDYSRALQSLRQYQLENRGWRWPETWPWGKAAFDWSSLAWVLALALFHWLGSAYPTVFNAGILKGDAVPAGQWWRLFTAMQLHADLAHLAANLTIGLILLGLAMGRYGAGIGILAAYLAGAGGNVATLLAHGAPLHGLGASGMVMGALGLLAAPHLPPFGKQARGVPLKHRLAGLLAGVMLFVLFGLAPETDVAAHAGGFATGLILGTLLSYAPGKFLRNKSVNRLAGVSLVAFAGLTWWLALR